MLVLGAVLAIEVLDGLEMVLRVVELAIEGEEDDRARLERLVLGRLVVVVGPSRPRSFPIGLGVVGGQMLGVVGRNRTRGRGCSLGLLVDLTFWRFRSRLLVLVERGVVVVLGLERVR